MHRYRGLMIFFFSFHSPLRFARVSYIVRSFFLLSVLARCFGCLLLSTEYFGLTSDGQEVTVESIIVAASQDFFPPFFFVYRRRRRRHDSKRRNENKNPSSTYYANKTLHGKPEELRKISIYAIRVARISCDTKAPQLAPRHALPNAPSESSPREKRKCLTERNLQSLLASRCVCVCLCAELFCNIDFFSSFFFGWLCTSEREEGNFFFFLHSTLWRNTICILENDLGLLFDRPSPSARSCLPICN